MVSKRELVRLRGEERRRNGDMRGIRNDPRDPDDALRRFFLKVQIDPRNPDRCWEWAASKNRAGYGQFRVWGRTREAYRWGYEVLIGPVPDGLTLDHLCRNRACVSPRHLEPVTMKVNILRGVGRGAQEARRTHCPAGHPYDLANTYHWRNRRICRTCSRERQRVRMVS